MKIQIETAQNVAIEYELASIGDRMLAYLIDFTIVASYLLLTGLLLLYMDLSYSSENIAYIAVMGIPFLFYELVCEILFDGRTVGKIVRNLKVISINGQQPNIGQYILRWLLRPIDIGIGLGGIAIMTIIINGKGQRLGDIVAGTSVINTKKRSSFSDTLFPELKEDYEPQFKEVIRLSDNDIRIVKEVLINYKQTRDSKSLQRLSQKIKDVLEIETDLRHIHFLETIIDDYHHLTSGV